MKAFEIPEFYRSPLISAIKALRKSDDKLKKDFQPTKLDFGPIEIYLARHFGFCYGVENAIEIAFQTVNAHPGKRIFLLSEMIHNPQVNQDLIAHGVKFIMDTHGNHYIQWADLNRDDIVIIPAFGTTLETEQQLRNIGIDPLQYNTTCPFVEKVWNRAEQIGKRGFSVLIHGKPGHEETRATFSHSSLHTPSLVVKDIQEARKLEKYILKQAEPKEFFREFEGQYSENFSPETDLEQIGVVNQTTMLASETQEIADYIKEVISRKGTSEQFAETRDTLCYATNDNQGAVINMLETKADLAIIVGGYNSSNTTHLVELCERKLKTYFIENDTCIEAGSIRHFLIHDHRETESVDFLPPKNPVRILLSSGASCPDAIVEKVIHKLIAYFEDSRSVESVIASLQ